VVAMKTTRTEYSIKKLVEAWNSAQLRRNEEYQRGAAWGLPQKQCFIDSIFRLYPIPPLFLQKIVSAGGLGGETSTRYDIVDGQQRLLALHGFIANNFALLAPEDRRLRLPGSLRSRVAPWAKKRYQELDQALREQFDSTLLDVYQIEDVQNSDEVRDLFIRLQSGTALSRQQIRDAWPGNLGPYIQTLAGKLGHRPSIPLFKLIDKRGTRSDEEEKDEYVTDRQMCAQLLRVFIARERDPRCAPSVSANDLDALYHEHTDFDVNGRLAKVFEDALNRAADVLGRFIKLQSGRTKVRKLDSFAVFQFFHDTARNDRLRFDSASLDRLARNMIEFDKTAERGKATSGPAIHEYYERWREAATADIGIRLDAKRTFDDVQKEEICKAAAGRCTICGNIVLREEAEYDHFPVAYRDGGQTISSNGRLVHQRCHARGRPVAGS